MQGSGRGKQGIALFDLDQTLVPWDTQLLFCNWVLCHEPVRRLFLLILLLFLPLSSFLGSEGMKRVFLSFLWRIRRERLEELVKGFVERYVPSEFYPALLEELARESARGRRTLLVSASPEFYVRPLGEALGFDASYGTRVEFGEVMPLFPDFTGGNNKQEVKVQRLLEEGEIDGAGVQENSAGYSDSTADLPMLRLCVEVTAVNPGAELSLLAEEHGWRVFRPERPFQGKRQMAWRCLKQLCGLERIDQ
ncbi:MAG: HAD-IB family phosphatase [Akkermansiaceae bacterium]|nr:HAD-IB family phosphatase [Akkermansiaceae bacterium]